MTCLDVQAEAARLPVVQGSRVCSAGYAPATLLTCQCTASLHGAMGLVRLTSRRLHNMVALVGDGGYTLLLAVTACLLVRYVGVWDDVRTVMLLVVLMILATSVPFDEVVARSNARSCLLFRRAFIRGGGQ